MRWADSRPVAIDTGNAVRDSVKARLWQTLASGLPHEPLAASPAAAAAIIVSLWPAFVRFSVASHRRQR